jgi:F-type H+-transporting ATPase subunit gamma
MTKARSLDKRRRSVRNIRKITRTMELISTTRSKRAMDRAVAAKEYTDRITALVGHLAAGGTEVRHPLLESRDQIGHATLLVLSANRGLCGGYNASIMRKARHRWQELQGRVPQTRLEVSGNRGITAFRFRGIRPQETYTHFEDRPAYDEVEPLADRYLEEYQAGRLDRLDVVYAQFESLSKQRAVLETLLPLSELVAHGEPTGPSHARHYEFLPSAESIVDELVPAGFKMKLFKCFLDAGASEQIARMTAMRAATENADTMIVHLSIAYNRARQGQITSELLEVISGAEALKK